jgi:hypothetical protein
LGSHSRACAPVAEAALGADGPRGEGWVALQLLLGAANAGCGYVGVYWPGSMDSFLGALGLLIALRIASRDAAHSDARAARSCKWGPSVSPSG